MPDAWQRVSGAPPSDDMSGGRAQAKLVDMGSDFLWKTDTTAPGNGVTRVGLVCNKHVKCEFKLMVKRVSGAFCVFWKGAHTAEQSKGKRANSKLSWSEAEFARKSMKTGSKPAEVLAALTDDLLEEAKGAGAVAEKRAEGGLTGVPFLLCCRDYRTGWVLRGVLSVYCRTVFSRVPPALSQDAARGTHITPRKIHVRHFGK